MATGVPTNYVWEIGIDWDSVHNGNGRYYLQEGFVLESSMAARRCEPSQ